jgi:hypothetical protein
VVKKKAALCLLQLYRKHPDCLVLEDNLPRLVQLLDFPSFSFLTAALVLARDLHT